MEGISIGRDYSRTASTDVHEFFAPLYPLLTGYSWLVDKAKFSFPNDQIARRFRHDVIARHRDCLYLDSGSLGRWAQYLYDDWCSIVGFPTMADHPRALVQAASGRLIDANIVTLTPAPDCVFHCVDAARWTFYARDKALIKIVREHIASRTGLRVWDLELGADVT